MTTAYDRLLERVHELDDLGKAAALLSWDREVNMPPAGDAIRIQQMATLGRLIHERFTSDEMGVLIERAAEELDGADYDGIEASLIRHLDYSYDRARRLPAEFVTRSSLISGQAHTVWVKAREDDDFASFQPWLAQIIALAQEMAELIGYEDEPYDALLDRYERDMRTASVRETFRATREALTPLLQAITERGRPLDDALLRQPFDIAQQQAFARTIATAAGYDFARGHLGTAVHPFATSLSRNDARITTRWYPDLLNASLFGTLHESGHAIYEQGTHADLARTPLARGASMGIHESQSRLFENMIGRSRGFWEAHFPALQAHFPDQLGAVSLQAFYEAINVVRPSFIRVEADELTYVLHIVLRFELEQAMLHGELAAADVRDAWNERTWALLGLRPPTDREGVLQDIHWTRPSFGYFPTYALGNLYAAQFLEAATAQRPAVATDLAAGQTGELLDWLRVNIHAHGRKFLPSELVERATGRPLDHHAFVRYATTKFGEVYAL
jgi:carboxypeptidase Taq